MKNLDDFKPFTVAEEKFLAGSAQGDRVTLGDGSLPREGSPEVDIRADLIRHLLLSSDIDARLHAKGIRVRGARIVDALDLQGCDCQHDITLTRCLFEKQPSFLNARMRGLHLSGSLCPGLLADNAVFAGSVYLRSGFESTSEISMPGVRISGDLQICDARLLHNGYACLFAASARIEGSVYLGDYPYDENDSELHTDGAIIFSSATIGQDFYCKNTAISCDDSQIGSVIYLDGEEGGELTALSLARADIRGALYCKANEFSRGILNLSGARVRRLNDEPMTERGPYKIRLDGLTYEDFAQETDTSIDARLGWLARRPDGITFSTQPYEQLSRVFSSMGHREDARRVLVKKEELKRRASIDAIKEGGERLWRIPYLMVANASMYHLIRYGYRPARAVLWGVLLIGLLSVYFHKTWNAGDMAPNAAPILISRDWIAATISHPNNPAQFWSAPDQAGKDYETFNAVAYATDLVVPIVNLGQEAAWAPSTSRSVWGWHGWWIRWFATCIGWVVTALGAAAVTGVIRRD